MATKLKKGNEKSAPVETKKEKVSSKKTNKQKKEAPVAENQELSVEKDLPTAKPVENLDKLENKPAKTEKEKSKKKKRNTVQYDRWGYFFIAPFFLVYIIFSLVPLVSTFTKSFQEEYMVGLEKEGPHYSVPLYFTGREKEYGKQMKNATNSLESIKSKYENSSVAAAVVEIDAILENAWNLDTEKFNIKYEEAKKEAKNGGELIVAVSELINKKEAAVKKNFRTAFAKNDNIGRYLLNTLIMWVFGFLPQILVSLLLAVWFTNTELRLKGQQFFKTVIYLPNLIMAAAFSMLFFNLFSPNGPINNIIIDLVDKITTPDIKSMTAKVITLLEEFSKEHSSDGSLVNAINAVISSLQSSTVDIAKNLELKEANTLLLSIRDSALEVFNNSYKGVEKLNVQYILSNNLKPIADGMKPIYFFTSTGWTRALVAVMNFLMWYGNTTILLMAGVMGIDNSLFEAARIDGANPIQIFFKVTIPLLLPIFVYVLITSLIGGIQMFDVPQILTNGAGGPDRTTMTMIMKLNRFLQNKNYGPAGATSILLFVITGILSSIVYKTTMSKYQNKR